MNQSCKDVLLHLGAAREALDTMQKELAEFDGNSIETARTFVALRQVKDEAEDIYKSINKSYEIWKGERLPNVFDAEGVPTVNLDEGFRVTVSHKVYASIKKDCKGAAYQWLRDNNLGDIITDTVNSSTLSAVAKAEMEANRELNPDYFNIHVTPSTSVTKTK